MLCWTPDFARDVSVSGRRKAEDLCKCQRTRDTHLAGAFRSCAGFLRSTATISNLRTHIKECTQAQGIAARRGFAATVMSYTLRKIAQCQSKGYTHSTARESVFLSQR